MASDPKSRLREAVARVARRMAAWPEFMRKEADAAPVFVQGLSSDEYGPPEPGVYLDSVGEWQQNGGRRDV